MGVSYAYTLDEAKGPSIKEKFGELANMQVVHNAYEARTDNSSLNDHDQYNFDAPLMLGDALAGRIRQIQFLIDQRRSSDAIALAAETLRLFDDNIPDIAREKLYTQMEDSAAYIDIHGLQDEADRAKRIILENVNLSSRWGNNLIEHIELIGFASIIRAMRAENTSDVNGPSMGVNRDFLPTLPFAA